MCGTPSIGSDTFLAEQVGGYQSWNASCTKVLLTWEGDSLVRMETDLGDKHTRTHTHRRAVRLDRWGQSLTHIPLAVPCDPERKHCSAHSLAGRTDGSRQRAGH